MLKSRRVPSHAQSNATQKEQEVTDIELHTSRGRIGVFHKIERKRTKDNDVDNAREKERRMNLRLSPVMGLLYPADQDMYWLREGTPHHPSLPCQNHAENVGTRGRSERKEGTTSGRPLIGKLLMTMRPLELEWRKDGDLA